MCNKRENKEALTIIDEIEFLLKTTSDYLNEKLLKKLFDDIKKLRNILIK